jgi:hypothetical protein
MVADVKRWLGVCAEKKDPRERERCLETGYELFKKPANAIGLGFAEMTKLYNRTVNEYFTPKPPSPAAQPAPTPAPTRDWVRNPTRDASAKVLTALTNAGQTGQSSADLAQSLYGETDYAAKGRVNQVVGRLRRRGYSIMLVGDDPFARRCVLRQN